MPSRYFFLASLPMLRFTDKAPMSWESFMDQARGSISGHDFELLCGIPLNKDGGDPFLKKWTAMNAQLDGAVNEQRKEKLGRASDTGVAFRDLEVGHVSDAAMASKNPLEAEKLLMKFRYDYLDRAKGYDPFTRAALLAYALQLRILIRKDLFTAEKGNSEYNRLFKGLQNELKSE